MNTKKVLNEGKRKISKARRLAAELEKAEREVFCFLDEIGADLTQPTAAENADNLGDAVSCYIQYEEFHIEGLMEEIYHASNYWKAKGEPSDS